MPELPQQVTPRHRRRHYFINRRIQLGLTVGLALAAAAVAFVLAAYSYVSVQNVIESLRSRAHLSFGNTRESTWPIVLRASAVSLGVLICVGAGCALLVLRKANRISRHFLSLFGSLRRGRAATVSKEAAAASPELAAAYAEIVRARDDIVQRAGAAAERATALVEQAADLPKVPDELVERLSAETETIRQALDDLKLDAEPDAAE